MVCWLLRQSSNPFGFRPSYPFQLKWWRCCRGWGPRMTSPRNGSESEDWVVFLWFAHTVHDRSWFPAQKMICIDLHGNMFPTSNCVLAGVLFGPIYTPQPPENVYTTVMGPSANMADDHLDMEWHGQPNTLGRNETSSYHHQKRWSNSRNMSKPSTMTQPNPTNCLISHWSHSTANALWQYLGLTRRKTRYCTARDPLGHCQFGAPETLPVSRWMRWMGESCRNC